VNLPTPITITGAAMALSLDLQVSKSIQFSACPSLGVGQYSFTPAFNLTPVTFASHPSNVGNGKLTGLTGVITSVDSTESSFTLTTADDPVWSASTNEATVFQGVTGTSSLVVGMPVNMDAAIQVDGSLLATRIEVDDTSTTDLSITRGPLALIGSSLPTLAFLGQTDQGYLYSGFVTGEQSFADINSTAIFQISGQLTNLQNLPFAASFTQSNMVAGQDISLTLHALYNAYAPLTTVTLTPQTINGTVNTVSSSEGFDIYTVTLAPYDLFPTLAVQSGQTTLLTNPNTVVVYVDSSTQQLNSGVIAIGSVLRFNGLVFNDNGTLRMDCMQVNDGVAE